MLVRGFDHFTIRTSKLKETRDFFIQLLNLKEGQRPSFQFAGYWLYLEDQPIFHLVEMADDEHAEVAKYLGMRGNSAGGSGSIDHLAFRIEGYASLLWKIQHYGWPFFERTVPDIHEHQLFLTDPNQITIELIFHDEEYQVWKRHNNTSANAS